MLNWADLLAERKAGDFRHTDTHDSAQKAAHSQGFDMSDAERKAGDASHRTFNLTPRSKKGKKEREKQGKPKEITHRIQRGKVHELGYDVHGNDKSIGKVGRDSVVDAMKSHWTDIKKTKKGSDKSEKAVADKKKVAKENRDKKQEKKRMGMSKVEGRPSKEVRHTARKLHREWWDSMGISFIS